MQLSTGFLHAREIDLGPSGEAGTMRRFDSPAVSFVMCFVMGFVMGFSVRDILIIRLP